MSLRGSTLLARDLLRAHVRSRSDHASNCSPRFNAPVTVANRLIAAGHLRHAEVEHLHVTAVVSIRLAGLMSRCVMPFACARSNASAACTAISTTSDGVKRRPHSRREGLPFDVLHDDEADAVALTDVVDGCDIRMIQRGCGLRFAREALHAVRVRRELSGQNLQRDGPVQSRIVREIHLTHAAGTEQRHDLVVTERSADERRLV